MYPELLTIEDCVFFGMDVKLLTHEFRVNQFRAGKVLIRRGAFIGAFAVIPCGVEIGEGAVVAACSVAYRDVPPGATLISAPPTILKLP
jgi:acetyltransferase-like isoleucine patch superfamily enzyme